MTSATLILALLSAQDFAMGDVSTDHAPITDVLLYTDSAVVTRRLRLPCPPSGIVHAQFRRLPADLDEQGIHVRAQGATVVSTRIQKPQQGGPALTSSELESLHNKRAALLKQIETDRRDKDRIERLWHTAQEASTRALVRSDGSYAAWLKNAGDLMEEQIALAKRTVATEAQADALDRKATTEQNRLKSLRSTLDPYRGYAVQAKLSCVPGESTETELHYLADQAHWQPRYEARSDAQTGTVKLTLVAELTQKTGEDWKQARLRLSTARPHEQATPPDLVPIQVFAAPTETKQKVEVVSESVETALKVAPVVVQRPTAPGSSIEVPVDEPIDVASGAGTTHVPVHQFSQKAPLRLRAQPKMSAAIYQVAELVNTAPFPLVPGSIAVFRDASFMGSQELPIEVPPGGHFNLSFGIEERISVTRSIEKEDVQATGLFGTARTHRYAYRFNLVSHNAPATSIEVQDHIPISELDGIAIRLDGNTTPGFTLDPEGNGIVSWRIDLPAGARKQVDLAFSIEVPSKYR